MLHNIKKLQSLDVNELIGIINKNITKMIQFVQSSEIS